jgi:hypothetical protein
LTEDHRCVSAVGINDLAGLWQRSMIAWPDGRVDSTTEVRWLQGFRTFVDLRQPSPIPDFSHADELEDLSMEDCRWLGTQQGFAGHLGFDGRHFEWVRLIDFRPASPIADAGSLEWQAGVLVERGRDVAYTEHWHRHATPGTRPCGAAVLQETELRTKAILVRVGTEFMFARDRTTPLPTDRTLTESIAAAANLRLARAVIDCEISFGIVTPEGFRITASTLPFRRGRMLGQLALGDTITTPGRANGKATLSVWEILDCEGDAGAILHIRS